MYMPSFIRNEQRLAWSKYILFFAAMLDDTNLSSNMAAKSQMHLDTAKYLFFS